MSDIKLTRQHFEFIAKVISEIAADDIRATTCMRFADNLQATNPNFKWDTFVKACGCEPAMVEVAKSLEQPLEIADLEEALIDGNVNVTNIHSGRTWTGAELVKEYRKAFRKGRV
jgi:hypothetical protein